MTLNFIFNFFQMKREFSLDLSTQSLVQVNVTRLVPVNPAPSWILSPRKKRFHVFDIHHGLGDLGEKHVWVWKRCFFFLEVKRILYLQQRMSLQRWDSFHLLSFGFWCFSSFPLDKIWHILANSVFVKELWRGDTKLNLSITQFYGLDVWHHQVNLSQVMVAAVIGNCYTAEVGGIIILPRTRF